MDREDLGADDDVGRPGDREQDRQHDHRQRRARHVRADVPPCIDDGRRPPREKDDVRDDDAEEHAGLEHDPEGRGRVTRGKDETHDRDDEHG